MATDRVESPRTGKIECREVLPLSSTPGAERCVKALFVAVVVLFPLQYWFVRHVTEPYPALVMPDFAGARLNADGQFSADTADVAVTFRDGENRTITIRKLLERAPSSQFQAMADIALKPKFSGPPPASLWSAFLSNELLQQVAPGYVLSKTRRRYWTGIERPTADWIRRRVKELFPGHTAARADIVWYTDVFTWDGHHMSRHRTRTNTIVVPL